MEYYYLLAILMAMEKPRSIYEINSTSLYKQNLLPMLALSLFSTGIVFGAHRLIFGSYKLQPGELTLNFGSLHLYGALGIFLLNLFLFSLQLSLFWLCMERKRNPLGGEENPSRGVGKTIAMNFLTLVVMWLVDIITLTVFYFSLSTSSSLLRILVGGLALGSTYVKLYMLPILPSVIHQGFTKGLARGLDISKKYKREISKSMLTPAFLIPLISLLLNLVLPSNGIFILAVLFRVLFFPYIFISFYKGYFEIEERYYR